MWAIIKNLGRSSLVYGLGSVLQKVILFVLLPVYTRYLPPDDYGTLALLNTTGNFLRPLVWMGMGQALVWAVVYHHADERTSFKSAFSYLMLQGVIGVALVAWFAPALSRWIFGTPVQAALLRLVVITVLIEVVEMLCIAQLRIHERAPLFARLIIFRFVLGAGLNILFLVPLRRGVPGLIEASLLTSSICCAVYARLMRGHLGLRITWPELKRLLTFAIPLAPSQVAAIVLVSSDRYFIRHYWGDTEVGLYSLGYSLALVLNLVVQATQMAWLPMMYQIARQPDAARTFRRMLTYYVLALGFFTLALSLLSRELLMLMATSKYLGAETVVPLIALSCVLVGVGNMTNVGISTRNKTYLTSAVVFVSAAVNLLMNFLLIPRTGMMGAAWATLISYAVQTLLLLAVNLRLWRIPYDYGRLCGVLLVGIVLYFAGDLIPVRASWGCHVALKLGLLAAYPVALWALGIIQPREKDALINLLRGLPGARR